MRPSTGVLMAALAAGFGLSLLSVAAAQPPAAVAQTSTAPDFGGPPSGEVPLLFNDHHVYAKPDRLRAGRVLVAIVRGSTILVPLRVVSEGMGAYVQWVDAKRTVVVRYLTAPVPTPPPAASPEATAMATPTAAPSASPAPAPREKHERFVVGDYIISPNSYNELNGGQNSKPSFRAAAAFEFPLFSLPWMIEGDFRSYRYEHQSGAATNCKTGNAGCANAVGKQGVVYVPAFAGRDDDVDARFALKVSDPRIYIGIGYEFRNTNFEGGAFPTQQHGLGVGLEKLPDLDQAFSLYGSMYYYPSLTTNGSQNLGDGTTGQVQYRYLKYNVGLTLDLGHSPLFLQGGYLGDRGYNKQNAPSDFSHQGPYAGLGIHF